MQKWVLFVEGTFDLRKGPFISGRKFFYVEGLLQKRLSLGMNVRGRYMAHVLG